MATRCLEMPNDQIERMSGNRHVHTVKGSPIEHNPHGYTPAERLEEITEDARKKQNKLLGGR